MQTRLNSKEGINFTEFSYQIFQAYDWLHLLKTYNCTFQVWFYITFLKKKILKQNWISFFKLGGNDQTGNIHTGYELISKVLPGKTAYGLNLPLITTETGEKLGKSVGNSVSLDSGPYSLYQFFFNTSDKMSEEYLKLFTFLPLNEIDDLMREHQVLEL